MFTAVCDELPGIANGVISYSPDMTAPYSVGTVATYECNEGYELTGPGDEMRTCMVIVDSPGASFGGSAPTCERKIHCCLSNFDLTSSNVFKAVCDELSVIANGRISYSPDMTVPYSVGTVASHSCNPGFELIGEVIRTCEDGGAGVGGVFVGSEPSCQRELVCFC